MWDFYLPKIMFYGNKFEGKSMKRIITSESVNIGHPDKTCDTIADAFLDEALRQDKNSQMAVECAIKDDRLFVYGEATTAAKIDYEGIAKKILKDIGYKNDFIVIKQISEQSADINQAVKKQELMANDQGMVYGFACNETDELMPIPIMIAHKLMKKYDEFRRKTDCYFADAKSQVSVCYDGYEPQSIDTILISVSHGDWLSHEQIVSDIKTNIIDEVLKDYEKYNKGVMFEKAIYEKFGQEFRGKDSVPFHKGGDIVINGKQVQIKYLHARVCYDRTLQKLKKSA